MGTEIGDGVAPTGWGRMRSGAGHGLGAEGTPLSRAQQQLGKGPGRRMELPGKRKQPKEQQSLGRRGFIWWKSLFAAQICGGIGRRRDRNVK